MLISVVTAVFNRAGTVAQALQSARTQSHEKIELIVQDGGSTDGTLQAIEALAEDRLRLVSAPDQGIYDAINKGIARATGEVVGLLHSDDFLASDRVLERVAQAFADPEVDAVYGDLDYVSAEDPTRILRRWTSCPFAPDLLARGWMPPHPTLYLRRRIFETRGLYDTSFRIAGDYDGVLRYFSQPGFRAVHIPHVLVKMRMGGASNKSLRHILQKSREDLRALRKNGVGGPGALLHKNLSKLTQFSVRR